MTDKEMLIKGQKGHLVPCMPLARASVVGATTKPLKPCNKHSQLAWKRECEEC